MWQSEPVNSRRAPASHAPHRLVIGTRGSPLALWQAHEVQRQLMAVHGYDVDFVPLNIIRTTGDKSQAAGLALSESGGKGAFTKEIDAAQLIGDVRIAVHSGKDLPTLLPEGLVEAGYLTREDPRDAFICKIAGSLADLPEGAVVGTASLRRQALVRRFRPDLRVEVLRGNVDTRLRKLAARDVHATLLAMAGLNRLRLSEHATAALDPEVFVPAVAQGAVGIVVRADDADAVAAAAAIIDPETTAAVTAERSLLRVLDGSCRTPIAGHCRREGQEWRMRGLVLSPDGREAIEIVDRKREDEDMAAFGARLGEWLKARIPPGFFDS
jgi:hydroxymethylbilane synthase